MVEVIFISYQINCKLIKLKLKAENGRIVLKNHNTSCCLQDAHLKS
jgi:hypothetical protein